MFMRNLMASQKSLAENGVMTLAGTGAPVDGTSGTGVGIAGPMSTYFDVTNLKSYINIGTLASPIWNLEYGTNLVQQISGTITAAQIISTAAGGLGHANGFIMVPAAPANFMNQLMSAVLINAFSVAAYTGGGNLTINIGGGGAALTGLIATANFIQAAANKVIEYVPLAAVPNVYTTANPLNLVSSVAPTNPGTAAGVFRYIVNYRVVPVGF